MTKNSNSKKITNCTRAVRCGKTRSGLPFRSSSGNLRNKKKKEKKEKTTQVLETESNVICITDNIIPEWQNAILNNSVFSGCTIFFEDQHLIFQQSDEIQKIIAESKAAYIEAQQEKNK